MKFRKHNIKLFIHRALSALLAALLLLSIAACSNVPPPRRSQPTGSSQTATQTPSSSPKAPQSTDADGSSGGAVPDEEPEPVAVERVTIVLESTEVVRDTVLTPTVVILPSDATDKKYTITSVDEEVLRRRGANWVAIGAGTTELIATAENGVTGSITVTVIVPVEAVSLGFETIIMSPGEDLQLAPVISPADATETQAVYSSDNEDAATVTEEGAVYAVGAGVATVTCTIGGVSTTLTVTVEVPVTSIGVSADRRTYKVGEQGRFTVQVGPQEATNKTYTVRVSGPAISLTEDNNFSCDHAGEVTIIATAPNGVSGSQTITVVDLNAFAAEVFRLTNVERENAGLPKFTSMPNLTQTAVMRANEIIQHFSHDRPDGRSCFTAFEENNVIYNYAGENLAMGQRTPAEVVQGWMESPGHRANIMKKEFGRLGVGVVMDSNGRLYWTQTFTD